MTGKAQPDGRLAALLADARPPGGDLVDEVLDSNLRAALFGVDRRPALGRLAVLEPIGSGAMGAVLSAYDPILDRKVAVKILRRAGADDRARILREAKALAKLSHQNVVTVHDAGELDGSVYLVMEQVEGVDLRSWMAEPRPWEMVVRVLRQAGAGLAAAHREGLVHSDIKPDNILVGSEQTKVVDFGLARLGDGWRDERGAPLQERGGLGGTPGYLAPERLAGGEPTAASDQYAFFVTLREALYGCLPGDERDDDNERAKMVPRWLRKTVHRGLDERPSERFGSMQEVVAALDLDRRRRRGRVGLLFMVAAAITMAVGAIGYRSGATQDRCGGGNALMASSWSVDEQAAVAERLKAVPAAFAADATERVLRGIDSFAERWQQTHRAVCRATHVSGEQSQALLELRMRCLERQRRRMDAWIAALGDVSTAGELAAAVTAASDLDAPERCGVVEQAGALALPTDPERRRRIAAEDEALAQARAAFQLGRYQVADAAMAGVAERTSDLDDAAFCARRDQLRATVRARVGAPGEAGPIFRAALQQAAAARAADLEAAIWMGMLRHELLAGAPARVIEWAPFAAAALTGANAGRAQLDALVGEAHRHLGDFASARVHLDAARRQASQLHVVRHALLLMNVGSVELAVDAVDAAEVAFVEALRRARGALGEGHPGLALYLDKRGSARLARGDVQGALSDHERAFVLRSKAYGAEDRAVASTRLRRGQALLQAGKPEAARADFDAAAAIRKRWYGPSHRRTIAAAAHLADAATLAGDHAGALREHERALAALAAANEGGSDGSPTRRAITARGLRSALHKAGSHAVADGQLAAIAPLGDREPAVVDLELRAAGVCYAIATDDPARAETLATELREALEPATNRGARSWLALGEAELALGRHAAADAALARALAALADQDTWLLARTKAARAQVLDAMGESKRATELAAQARRFFERAGKR